MWLLRGVVGRGTDRRLTTPAHARLTRNPAMPDTLAFNPLSEDQKLLAQVIDYYQRSLKEATEGLNYLRSRGVTVGEAIDRFRIGYANRTLGLKLPVKQLKAGKQIRTRLQQLGLFRDTGREHFNGCVTFPITSADGTGQIVDIYGRKTRNDLRKGTPSHMHLSEQRGGVWNVEAFHAGNEIILCPSLFDALSFWNAGYRNVTCTFGADALTDDHLVAFREFGIRSVLAVSAAIIPKLLAAGLDCYLLRLPPGIDVNQYALEADDPSKALGAIIRMAEWLGKGQRGKPAVVPAVEVPVVQTPAPAMPDEAEPAEPEVDDEADALEEDDLDDLEEDGLEEIEEEADSLDSDDLDDDEPDQPADASPPDLPLAPAPILTASPVPPPPQDIEADISGDEVVMQLGHRRYRVRGLSKNMAFDQMKVNVLATTEKGMFVDTFDLYIARHRRQFIVQAAAELGVEEQTIKKDLGRRAAQAGRVARRANQRNDGRQRAGPGHDARRKG